MRHWWSRVAVVGLGLLVGGVFLVLAFRGTPPDAVWGVLKGGHWGLPALTVLAGTGLFVYAKVVRWRLLLGSPAGLSIARLARPVLAGLALNSLIPHSGEFVRAVSLNRQVGLASAGVLSSIVAERVFDLFGVLLLGAFALPCLPVTASLEASVRLLGLVAAVLAVCILSAVWAPQRVRAVAQLCARVLPLQPRDWSLRQVNNALLGIAPVRSGVTALAVLGWSLVQWLAVALAVWGCQRVIGFDAGLPATLLVVVGIVVAFLLPNAPGYAGSVQIAFAVTLTPLHISSVSAIAASIVYQLLMVLPLVVAGLCCLRASLKSR
jgi:uncharacterized membrane protein YbhN (UPF0104 family)